MGDGQLHCRVASWQEREARADIYSNTSDYEEAIADYDRVIALKPDDAQARANRAQAIADRDAAKP